MKILILVIYNTIALSKHGSLWNPIKIVIFSTKKGSAIDIS